MKPIRVGIIGTGKHGSRYARHVREDIAGLDLAAISRRSPDGRQQADQWRCLYFQDWRELVASGDVEAVISVVPPALNLEIARACHLPGKPLLVEKPLAASLPAARSIAQLGADGAWKLTVGQTLRYNQVIRRMKQLLPQMGALHTFSANQRLEPSTLAWHEQPELAGAGVSYHTAVHVFDALRFITGRELVRVMAVTAQVHNHVLEDILLALVELEGGVKGVLDCSKVGQARSGRYEFVCEQGQLTGDQVHGHCSRGQGMEIAVEDPGPAVPTIRELLADWYGFLSGAAENPVSAADGLAAVAACDACLRSARSGRWERVIF